MWHRFSPDNHARTPAWRWDRAQLARSGALPLSRRRDDATTQKAIRFLAAVDRLGDAPEARDDLAERFGPLFWAREVHAATAGDDARLRHETEARILAGSDDAEIAAKTGLSPAVVGAYAGVFFSVRDRLDRQGYILHKVVGARADNLNESNVAVLWRYFGYVGGPHVLDTLVRMVDPSMGHSGPEGTDGFWGRVFDSAMARKAALTAQGLRINDNTQGDIIHLYQKKQEAAAAERAALGGAGESDMLARIGLIIASVPLESGRPPALSLDLRADRPSFPTTAIALEAPTA